MVFGSFSLRKDSTEVSEYKSKTKSPQYNVKQHERAVSQALDGLFPRYSNVGPTSVGVRYQDTDTVVAVFNFTEMSKVIYYTNFNTTNSHQFIHCTTLFILTANQRHTTGPSFSLV